MCGYNSDTARAQLERALRDTLTPDAVAQIAAALRLADGAQLVWFRAVLESMVERSKQARAW